MARVVIVSNRVPIPKARGASAFTVTWSVSVPTGRTRLIVIA